MTEKFHEHKNGSNSGNRRIEKRAAQRRQLKASKAQAERKRRDDINKSKG